MKIKSLQRKSVASVPSEYSGQERRFAQSVSQELDTLSGRRGNLIDRAVTFRDLLDAGVLSLTGGQSLNLSGGSGVEVVNTNQSGLPAQLPTRPEDFVVAGGFGVIFLSWSLPPYVGHDHIEIYRLRKNNPTDQDPTLDQALEAGVYNRYYGDVMRFSDTNVGSQETWYYWIRAVNRDGIVGAFYSSVGSHATTVLDYLYISGLIDDILDDDVSALGLNETIGALDTNITNLSTTVGNNTTSISTNALSINGVQGKYSVKIDNNGHVSGFGLISTANNGAVTSSFIVAADRFAIAKPYNSGESVATRYPFKVFTTATAVNGETIPAGVYIDDAFIHNAQITTAMIKDATITTAKILDLSATKITSGNIQIDASNDIKIYQGKTSFNSNNSGFWLGLNNNAGSFHVGSSASKYLKFDGNSGGLVTSGIKVLDSNGEVLLDAGGGGIGLEGGSIIRNGSFRDQSKTGAVYLTNTDNAEIIDGWETADSSSGATLTSYWDLAGFFRFEGDHTIRTQNKFPVLHGETLYLAVNNEMPLTYYRDWAIQVQFQGANGAYIDQEAITWDSVKWGDTAPAEGVRTISQALIPIPNNSNIRTCSIRIDGGPRIATHVGYDDDDYHVKIWNVYLGRSPSQITGKTIDTYIRDLSVDTFKIQNEAVTLPEVSDGVYNASVGYTEVELTTTNDRITFSWSDVRDRPSKIILLASMQAQGDTNQRVGVRGSIKDTSGNEYAAATQSHRETDGGQTVVTGMIDMSGKSSPLTLKLMCRVYLGANGTGGSRTIYDWTMVALAAKK